jgi:hypothetical protein
VKAKSVPALAAGSSPTIACLPFVIKDWYPVGGFYAYFLSHFLLFLKF